MRNIKYLLFSVVLLFVGSAFITISTFKAGLSQDDTGIQTIKDTIVIEKTIGKFPIADSQIVSLNFQFGNYMLSSLQNQVLFSKLQELDHNKKYLFILDGFSDSTGVSVKFNSLLATRRSFSVYEYLIGQGIPKESIFIRSFGISSRRKVDISITEVPQL